MAWVCRSILLCLSLVVVAEAATPVQKVIELLTNLKDQITGEIKETGTLYDQFACFCKDKTKDKSESIEKEQDTIDTESASIEENSALLKSEQKTLAKLKATLEEKSAELANKTAIFEQDKQTYNAKALDLKQAIHACGKALVELRTAKSSMSTASLLELGNTVRSSLAVQRVVNALEPHNLQAFSALVQEADPGDYKFKSDTIIKLLEELDGDFRKNKDTLDTEWTKTKTTFEQEKGALEAAIETTKTEIGTSEEKISDFTEKLAKSKENLVEAEANFKDDSLYLHDLTARCESKAKEWDQQDTMRKDEVKALEEALKVLEDTVKDLDTKVNKRAIDPTKSYKEQFLVAQPKPGASPVVMVAATTTRKPAATTALKAVATTTAKAAMTTAVKAVKSTTPAPAATTTVKAVASTTAKPAATTVAKVVAKAAASTTAKPAAAKASTTAKPAAAKVAKSKALFFLQEGKNSAGRFLAGVREHDANSLASRRERAVEFLRSEGSRLDSKMLAAAATHIAEMQAPMVNKAMEKVKKMVQDLLERLLAESAGEATKKGFCDTKLGEKELSRKTSFTKTRSLAADIAGLEATKAQLEDEIKEAASIIKDTTEALDNATSLRAEEKAQNTNTVTDAAEGKKAVGEAITILKDFYKKASKATVLSQTSASPIAEDMPKGGELTGAYKGNTAQSTNIIELLTVIHDDFDRTVRLTEEAEKQAVIEFVDFERASKVTIEAKTTAKTLDEEDLSSTTDALTATYTNLETEQGLLDGYIQEIEALKPMCIDTSMLYKERKEKRENDIKALKQAITILTPED